MRRQSRTSDLKALAISRHQERSRRRTGRGGASRAQEGAGLRARGKERAVRGSGVGGARKMAARGGKGKAHGIDGNDGGVPQRACGWCLPHRMKRRRRFHLRHGFLFFYPLSSINTVPHQQKSINRG